MPFYEYECENCGHFMEVMQKMSDAPLMECPQCGQPKLKKLISAAAFHLKGAGWYATDFKGGKGGPDKAAENKPAEQKKPDTTCGSGACPACSD